MALDSPVVVAIAGSNAGVYNYDRPAGPRNPLTHMISVEQHGRRTWSGDQIALVNASFFHPNHH